MHKAVFVAASFAAGLMFSSANASAQLRIVTMNATNSSAANAGPRTGMQTILQAIGSNVLNDPNNSGPTTGIAKKVDILCLQEWNAANTTGQGYANLLNSMYGTTTFAFGTLSGATTGSGTQGVIYNSATVQLLAEAAIGTTSSNGMARQAIRHKFRPVGYDNGAADFYIYNSHYKSSEGESSRRLAEATTIRADADALGASPNVIHVGDFNMFTSNESGYQKLLSAGTAKLNDPINKPGNWNDGITFKNIHTQTPYDSTIGQPGFDGGGGMDSRFDFQLISNNVNDRNGFAYIPNSYQAFGNKGLHQLGMPLTSGGDGGIGMTALNALASILDHLPVGADYQLPARMGVSVSGVPNKVIAGANIAVDVTVTNTAPVQFTNGADGLTYMVNGAGAVTGSGGAIDKLALTAGNVHTLALATDTPGLTSGTVNVSSSSEAVADGSFSAAVSTTVLGHATPSFAPDMTINTATIDFGIKGRGLGGASDEFLISNLAQFASLTARLDLDSIDIAGDTDSITTDLATFTNLSGGSFSSYGVNLSDANNGTFSETFTLNFSDEDLPGAIARGPLTLVVSGIVATPGDADLNGVINFDDYAHIDNGFNNVLDGWTNGDFDGNGVINFDDYALIDLNFNNQLSGAPGMNAIPEPTLLGLAGVQALTCMRTRRKRR